MMKLKRAIVTSTVLCGLTLGLASQPAQADTFVLSNTNANGSVSYDAGSDTYTLNGGNNFSFTSGSTTFSTIADSSFNYFGNFYYETDDGLPRNDPAGYYLNGSYNSLVGDSTYGPFSFAVAKGDTYGFYVNTTDNIGGAGRITFSAPKFSAGPGAPAPEVGVGLLSALAAGLALALARIRSGSFAAISFIRYRKQTEA